MIFFIDGKWVAVDESGVVVYRGDSRKEAMASLGRE